MNEQWLPVAGWERLYEVSDAGRIRSLPREVRGGNGSRAVRGGRILRAASSGGYEHVSLSNGTSKQNARVHVLVAKAFLGPRPNGMHACHKDGNSRNNAGVNLYWGTPAENIHDKARHGTDRYAMKRGACPHGHEYTKENTYISATGSPTCRTCRREGMRNRKAAA